MIKAQDWCVEQVAGENNWRYLKMHGAKGGLRSFSKVTAGDDVRTLCQGHIHLCFNPLEYYLYNDEFPQIKPDILDLQISKRFSDRGLTMDAGNFIHRCEKITGKTGWLNCLFVPRTEITELCSFIQPWKKIHSCHIIPGAAAVAGLLKTVTSEAVLVFFLDNRESQVLVVRDGIPLYNQSLTLSGPGKVDVALVLHAIDFARALIKKDHNIDQLHITCLGRDRESLNLQELGIKEWIPDFSKTFDLEAPEEVLLYPRLFGAPYVDHAYDFLPKDFARSWRMQSFSLYTSVLAAVAGTVLLGGWLYLQPAIKEQRVLYETLSTSISQQQQALRNRIPKTADLDTFARLKTIRTLAAEDFRLDDLVEKLSLALPTNVHITSLQVRRKALEQSSAAPPAPGDINQAGAVPGVPDVANIGGTDNSTVPERIQAQKVMISMVCVTSGSHGEVTARFENVIIALNNFFKVVDMNWNYREADGTGRLNCELLPKQEEAKP